MTASSSGSSAHVAVIIPTRDRAALLQRALATVEQQRGADVEVIVVDDGSADAASVAAACEAHPCVRLVRRESGGNVSAARNAGIAATAAPWLAFLDDDDVWAPGKLERQLAAAHAHAEAPWVVCGEVGFGPEREMLWVTPAVEGLDYGRELLGGNVVPGGASGVVARTAVVRRLGGFDEQLANFADWDLWIRLASVGEPAVVPEALVGYAVDQRSMSTDVARGRRDMAHVDRKHQTSREIHGVGLRRESLLWYFSEQHLRSGRRARGAGTLAVIGWRYRRPRAFVLAVAAAVAPGRLLRERRRAAQEAITAEDRARVTAWLDQQVQPTEPVPDAEVGGIPP